MCLCFYNYYHYIITSLACTSLRIYNIFPDILVLLHWSTVAQQNELINNKINLWSWWSSMDWSYIWSIHWWPSTWIINVIVYILWVVVIMNSVTVANHLQEIRDFIWYSIGFTWNWKTQHWNTYIVQWCYKDHHHKWY